MYQDKHKNIIEVTVDDYFLPDIKYLKEIVRFLIVYPITIVGILWVLALYFFAIFVGWSIGMYIAMWLGFFGGL